MISIADILAKRSSKSPSDAKPTPRHSSGRDKTYPKSNQHTPGELKIPYSSANLRSKARVYAVIHDYLQIRFSHYEYKFFIKHLAQNKVIIDFQSRNNSLITSLNLNKIGLCGQFYELLKQENLITADTHLSLNLKLG